jgi:hypothetical protein
MLKNFFDLAWEKKSCENKWEIKEKINLNKN